MIPKTKSLETFFALCCCLLALSSRAGAQSGSCENYLYFYRQLQAVERLTEPPELTPGMTALPEGVVVDPTDPNLEYTSKDISAVTNSPEFKEFAERYNISSLRLPRDLNTQIALVNAQRNHLAAYSRARTACDTIGQISHSLKRLQEHALEAADQNNRLETIDYMSEFIQIEGNALLLVATMGASANLQAARMGLKADKVRLAGEVRYLASAQTWEKTIQKPMWKAVFGADLPEKLKEAALAVRQITRRKDYLLRMVEASTIGVANASAQLRNALVAQAFGMTVNASNIDISEGSLGDFGINVLVGGNIWRQFKGCTSPFDAAAVTLLEQRKRWGDIFRRDVAEAAKYKREAEYHMRTLVNLSKVQQPSNVANSFLIVRHEEQQP